MSELIVIYDPAAQVGAIIDPERGQALGPAEVGEIAPEILQAFVDQVGAALDGQVPTTCIQIYAKWKDAMIAEAEASTGVASEAAQEPPAAVAATGAPEALAEATAAASGPEPPAQQPADTDEGAASSVEPVTLGTDGVVATIGAPAAPVVSEQTCPNCNGDGIISYGTEEPSTQCGMCGGTGKVTVSS